MFHKMCTLSRFEYVNIRPASVSRQTPRKFHKCYFHVESMSGSPVQHGNIPPKFARSSPRCFQRPWEAQSAVGQLQYRVSRWRVLGCVCVSSFSCSLEDKIAVILQVRNHKYTFFCTSLPDTTPTNSFPPAHMLPRGLETTRARTLATPFCHPVRGPCPLHKLTFRYRLVPYS